MLDNITLIKIPAYDASGKGLIIPIKITYTKSNKFSLTSIGNIATALKNNFIHTLEIISTLRKPWESLLHYRYILECDDKRFTVKDAKSSGMAISIALFNIYHSINGNKKVNNITGTGILRIDGSFDSSSNEKNKTLAATENEDSIESFITTKECNHLYDLETLMNNHK